MLDAVGFAAAQAHRGVKLIRMPSTVLAQNDAGIGVKNGINLFGKKNFAGHFAPPVAVFNDYSLLNSLEDRHFKAGYAEAVKVALIKDSEFFNWLEQHVGELAARQASAVEYLIEQCAALHLAHISSGDPFESGSSRPLDYGHWLAHKLEKLTQNQVLHGEAVAIGMSIDALYATQKHGLAVKDYERIVKLLKGLGFELQIHQYTHVDFGIDALLAGLEEFREHLGGDLCISMLTEIGQSLDVNQIDFEAMRKAISEFY
jgi:3-dehydroquinate synthase